MNLGLDLTSNIFVLLYHLSLQLAHLLFQHRKEYRRLLLHQALLNLDLLQLVLQLLDFFLGRANLRLGLLSVKRETSAVVALVTVVKVGEK